MKRQLENQALASPLPYVYAYSMEDDEVDDEFFSDFGNVDDFSIAQRYGGRSHSQGRSKVEKRHEKRGCGLQRGSVYSSKHVRMIERRTGTNQRGT